MSLADPLVGGPTHGIGLDRLSWLSSYRSMWTGTIFEGRSMQIMISVYIALFAAHCRSDTMISVPKSQKYHCFSGSKTRPSLNGRCLTGLPHGRTIFMVGCL
jgi:hypothetical protein